MKKKLILGITGFKNSGKGLVSNYFVERGFKDVAFADPMKKFLHEVFPFHSDDLWGPSENRETECHISWLNVMEHYLETRSTLEEPFLGSFAIGALNAVFEKHFYENSFFASPRECLQTIGEWARGKRGKDFWVNLTLSKINYLPEDKIVISDCRHKSELKRLKEVTEPLYPYLIRVTRTEYWDANPDKDPRKNIDTHISEKEQLSIPDSDFNEIIDLPEGKEKVYDVLDKVYRKLTS